MFRGFTRHLAPALLVFALLGGTALAQENTWVGKENGPQMRARLIDKEKNLARRLAVVEVEVKGVALADPTGSYPLPGEGHLQFRLDNSAYILPLNDRIAFEALAPGKHTIEVSLADHNYQLLTPTVELQITVP